jgi:tetratricopeptide (TPR) repeat protein
MSKPGRRTATPSDEMARFTNRENEQALFQHYLNSGIEPPMLMFYGVGGAGKTWLLKKLRTQAPAGIPSAYLDFDAAAASRRFVLDPVTAMQSIQQQLAAPAPRFDLALAMLHHRRGGSAEQGVWIEAAAEIVGSFVPGGGTLLKHLSKHLLARLKGTALEKLLASTSGAQLALELRSKTEQEIANELVYYLAADFRESLPDHLHRAVKCVLFFDTFEAVGKGFQNDEHRHLQEKWIQDLAAEFDFALTVIAGQNRLCWDEFDPDWASHLDQHLVGGLSEIDARGFLGQCDIVSTDLQDSILATSKESTGGYHCFSLGLCADIVFNERRAEREPNAETLHFNPQHWERLARRFLKSLTSNAERRWIERLTLTLRFDEAAARRAFSTDLSVAQDAAWEDLHDLSFVESIPDSDWSSIRAEMRSAMRNQPSAQERVMRDHQWWKDYWSGRSLAITDDAAAMAWYHSYHLEPVEAMKVWNSLVRNARTAMPARMREQDSLTQWLDPLGLLDSIPSSASEAEALLSWGVELWLGSLNRSTSLLKAIACFEVALRVVTEQEFPRKWAAIQRLLGDAWSDLPTGDRSANLEEAVVCFEAALRIRTEEEFPQEWAETQVSLGGTWSMLPTGDRSYNLEKAIACHEAALRIRTEQAFPQEWALTENSLGIAWAQMPTGNRGANLGKALACFEAALRIYTEQEFPQEWAGVQRNLGAAWSDLPTGDLSANLERAIACNERSLRVFTEQEFPQEWAMSQGNLGNAWSELSTGDRSSNLEKAIACNEAALRVFTECEFPRQWAMTEENLGIAWAQMPTGNRVANLEKAIACYEAALRVFAEREFPQDWAMTQWNLGGTWSDLPTGNRSANLEKAMVCFEAALRIRTEEAFPQEWAETQISVGGAWSLLPTGDRSYNLEKAIACYEAALRVFNQREFPQDWAMTQWNLGLAWHEMPTGDRAINLESAIAYYESALRIYTELGFPWEQREIAENLSMSRATLAELQMGSDGDPAE